MTYGKYITNATYKGINVDKAHEKLIGEWYNKSISYPRSDGIHHPPIVIIEPKKINPEVKNLLEFDATKIKKNYFEVTKENIYHIAEYLQLSTPSSLIGDIKRVFHKAKRVIKDEILEKSIYLFKNETKIDDVYVKIDDISLDDIITLKNKKLDKDLFNEELDFLRKN